MSKAVSCQPSAASRIQNAFSKAAPRYDELATLQQVVGLRFLSQLESENPRRILDIGMGTGWFTENLLANSPSANVVGIDFAPGMIKSAKDKQGKFSIAQADAKNLPFRQESFDLVVSNLAYQWVADLDSAFSETFRALQKGGVFYLTAFGQRSLHELFTAFDSTADNRPKDLPLARLPSKEDFANALVKAGFENLHVVSENFKAHFADVPSLLRWLKDIGANNFGQGIFLGKEHLLKMNQFYKNNFSDKDKIVATFEVIWVKARKQTED